MSATDEALESVIRHATELNDNPAGGCLPATHQDSIRGLIC